MKAILILLLVLSMVFVGGCGTDTGTTDIGQPGDVVESEEIQAIGNSLLSEDDDVEIGEMI